MNNKIVTIYTCSNCDAQFSKWNGRCLECGSWGTLKEQIIDQKDKEKAAIDLPAAEIIDFSKIKKMELGRTKTGFSELDRVLGGGVVPGSLILLAGEPGIGKSTILAQVADATGSRTQKVKKTIIYVSGEESATQIKSRLDRLGCSQENILFIGETNTEKIISAVLKVKPELVIVDSIQTVYSSLVPSEAGSINQIRACTVKFLETAKENNIAVILAGHITKDGQVAGPKSLEHIVDTVIYLESEQSNNYRLLRSTKNRFGSVNELGVFEMTGQGFKEVLNPSAIFMEANEQKISGSVISSVIEGSRPFMVEVQALVSKTVFGYPQRKASGFDLNRLQVLTAVLTKRANVNLNNQDVILSIVGGLKINDPALDLAVCLAIISSLLNQSLDRKTIVLGEVGLGGEIRNVNKLKERLAEAEKIGFKEVIIPNSNISGSRIKLTKVGKLKDIIKQISAK